MSTLLGLLMTLVGLLDQQQIVYAAEPVTVPRPLTIEERVREEFKDVPIMIEVARCESKFKNLPSKTGDFGPFQINQVHLPELDTLNLTREDVDDNIMFARVLYTRSGLKPWENSKWCWGKNQ